MKVRNFYPKQVMKRLARRDVETLDAGEKAALNFFLRKGRKFGIGTAVLTETDPTELLAANNAEEASAILANCTTRIHLTAY
ncbi:hypothetical protein [Marinobacterium jannaschii]|uniref:hypothetical protein n=1 Tax=Marinobacterium jannaschii TaxID=64970 RepID=UPI000480FEFC|nr:hypothetical protein [Marinobacterium jannaschii]